MKNPMKNSMKKQLPKAALIVFCMILPLFLLLLSYKLTLTFIEMTPNQKQTLDFLEDDDELTLDYTAAELSHLEDVKAVMKYTTFFFYAFLACLLMIIYLKWLGRESRESRDNFNNSRLNKDRFSIDRFFWYGGLTSFITTAIFLLAGLFFFEKVFAIFHLIFFPQGNWMFSADSMLIQTFPLDFFIMVSMNIFGLTWLAGIIMMLAAKYSNYLGN